VAALLSCLADSVACSVYSHRPLLLLSLLLLPLLLLGLLLLLLLLLGLLTNGVHLLLLLSRLTRRIHVTPAAAAAGPAHPCDTYDAAAVTAPACP
jgi:hypothetical protein